MSTNLLKKRHDVIARSTRDNLSLALKHLEQQVAFAQRGLLAGDQLDENLILNSSGISTLIARYNLCLDYQPYIDGAAKTPGE